MNQISIYIQFSKNAINFSDVKQTKRNINSLLTNYVQIQNYIQNKIKQNSNKTFNIIFQYGEKELDSIFNVMYKFICANKASNINFYYETDLLYELKPKYLSVFKLLTIKTDLNEDTYYFKNNQNLWKSNLQTLQKNNVPIEISVYTSLQFLNRYSPEQFLIYINKLKINHIDLIRTISDSNNTNVTSDNILLHTYLFNMYKLWKSTYNNIKIPLFNNLLNSITNNNVQIFCSRKFYEQNITITQNCQLCCHPYYQMIPYYNILTNTVLTPYKSLANKQNILQTNCYICPYYNFCHGDLVFLKSDLYDCPGLKKIIEYQLNQQNKSKIQENQ